jgi:hypothetical protein
MQPYNITPYMTAPLFLNILLSEKTKIPATNPVPGIRIATDKLS